MFQCVFFPSNFFPFDSDSSFFLRKAFTPTKILPGSCIARTWSSGRGNLGGWRWNNGINTGGGPLALRNYLGHLVGHEGAGSLQSFLKRRGVGVGGVLLWKMWGYMWYSISSNVFFSRNLDSFRWTCSTHRVCNIHASSKWSFWRYRTPFWGSKWWFVYVV